MSRRTIVINSVLGVALLGVGVATAVAVTGGSEPALPGTTVSVQRGTVTATVTATGNVESRSTVAVNASASGKVTKIYVKEGERVDLGDKLVKIDDSSAREDLRTARANLASAEATMTTTLQGRSAEDQAVDDAAVRSAETSVDNARTALRQAESTYKLDKKQQAKLVDRAEDTVTSAKQQKSDDEDALRDAHTDLAAAQQAGDTARISELQGTITQLQASVAADETAIDNAETGLAQARLTRDKTLQSSRQAVQTQQGQVDSAENALASQQAQRRSNQQPARQGAVDSAQAQIDNAQVSVEQAEQAVRDTTLRAPVAGTVADIAAVVGQSSASAGTGGSTTSGASGPTDTGTSGSSAASSTSPGLVTLVDDGIKQVSAAVAEADVVKVKLGQSVAVGFPASGKTLTGDVTSVATESTLSNNVVQYAVAVSLPTADRSIRLGQTANVTITTGSHANVLYVPTSAITTTGVSSTVTRRANGTDAVVQVETGLVGSTGTEIIRGLHEGDEVVLPTGGDTGGLTFPGGGSGSSSASASPAPSSGGPR